MFSLKKVLCPVDFSAASQRSLAIAVEIVRRTDADLYVLHVLGAPAVPAEHEFGGSRAEAVRESSRIRLAELVSGHSPDLRPHILVTDGDAPSEILRIEEFFGIDLIVIAPHRSTTIGRVIFGSVAEKVSRASRANVLLVREHFQEEQNTAG